MGPGGFPAQSQIETSFQVSQSKLEIQTIRYINSLMNEMASVMAILGGLCHVGVIHSKKSASAKSSQTDEPKVHRLFVSTLYASY